MLIVREEQFEAIRANLWRQFKARVAAHMAEVLPARVAQLGADGVAQAIDTHVAAAQAWGLTSERDLTRYVDLIVALGAEVWSDVQASWVGPVMAEPDETPSERLATAYALLPGRAPDCAELAAWWVS